MDGHRDSEYSTSGNGNYRVTRGGHSDHSAADWRNDLGEMTLIMKWNDDLNTGTCATCLLVFHFSDVILVVPDILTQTCSALHP